MFVEGSVALVPGVWYQLAVHGDELLITGPVNALPGQQTFTRRVSETVMASMNDHLVITSVASNGDAFYLVFTRLRDRSAEELAREFGARPETPGVDTASAR